MAFQINLRTWGALRGALSTCLGARPKMRRSGLSAAPAVPLPLAVATRASRSRPRSLLLLPICTYTLFSCLRFRGAGPRLSSGSSFLGPQLQILPVQHRMAFRDVLHNRNQTHFITLQRVRVDYAKFRERGGYRLNCLKWNGSMQARGVVGQASVISAEAVRS
jgi:hypothetical protein